MTISRVKPADWGTGEKLTSAQMNDVDKNTSYALDKRSGQTDTLESVVSCTGQGRIRPAQVIAANANTTYQTDDGQVFRFTNTVVGNKTYTLGNTGAELSEGDEVFWFVDDDVLSYRATIKNHDGTTLFELGTQDSHDGAWASFRYDGTDWKLARHGRGSREIVVPFTSSSTWECPAGVYEVELQGVGAGGGGGGGGGGNGVTGSGSGAGGGGAQLGILRVTVTPGVTYTVTIGTGGAGGVGGASGTNAGNNGSSGTDTTFSDGVTAYTFYGAAGGVGGSYTGEASATSNPRGGNSRRGVGLPSRTDSVTQVPQPGQGGWGSRSSAITALDDIFRAGGGSTVADGGTFGADSGGRHGGGGGGASGWLGGTGGAGGTAAGAGSVGTLGSGGGGGAASTAGGGNGGRGGDGALRIIYVK